MNSLSGYIANIVVNGQLSLVSVKLKEDLILKAIVVETPETVSYLKEGKPINLLFKETEVVMGTNENHSISLQNRISGKIKQIEKGSLISKIILDTAVGEVVSIISTNAVEQLALEENASVIAMIKLNEMMLSQ